MRDPQSRSHFPRPRSVARSPAEAPGVVATAKLVVIININPDWRIRSDPYNWIIENRRKGGATERWNAMGYYGDLDGAVFGLVQRRVRVIGGQPTMPRP